MHNTFCIFVLTIFCTIPIVSGQRLYFEENIDRNKYIAILFQFVRQTHVLMAVYVILSMPILTMHVNVQ